MSRLPQFLAVERGLALVTFHRYPLTCFARPGSTQYATIANLLSDRSSHGLAQDLASLVAKAHAQGLPFRVDELNSVACAGKRGVSDTFASALWALDSLFELARAGVDGVNIHTLPGARYQPFAVFHAGGRWVAIVRPEYYGLLMFARAAPLGSRLLPINAMAGSPVKIWATLGPDERVRFVLINKSASSSQVLLRVPGFAGAATVEQLVAPSLAATSGVTLGGQSFGQVTPTGTLSGPPMATVLHPVFGLYAVSVPAATATMLTLGPVDNSPYAR
jgi:hypothetical protein